eukprot:TRINITY_DN13973_c3_g1_i1.p1 TRINITY_DN13973_c3_g1~~TRINITY_DN13973_c3_g1_i1.p1  ORF type:complete len:370 (+),score=82.50 TRINITY_DN13973_c3_g1_i1:74-1111(+)
MKTSSVARRQRRLFGLQASEVSSRYEKMEMKDGVKHEWHKDDSYHKGGMWQLSGTTSYIYPKQVRGRGMEFRKFFGEERLVTPFYHGGPTEVVHDSRKNQVFFNEWEFSDSLREAKHLPGHIQTMGRSTYFVNHFSRQALKCIARSAHSLVERKRIPNPHFPSQPLLGPAEVPVSEMDVYRKQAFLAGIEFPEFPDVQPVSQIDPWDEEGESSVPRVSNDSLLDAEMWEEINKNMVGMEKKVRAFKDTERKKIWTWKMSLMMQQIKRARQEEIFMAKQRRRTDQKQDTTDESKPWIRKARAEEAKKKDEDVSEEIDIAEATREELKEAEYHRRQAGTHRPPGTKM